MGTVIQAEGLTHRYGRHVALRDVDLEVPEGALYALLGPNGAGKTTLLKILLGLLRPTAGRVTLLGKDLKRLTLRDRASIGYVAEDQRLPGWMTLSRLLAYLAPLYPTWDHGLASELQRRFHLPPGRKIRAMSRGERMKAAMMAALAPRPRLLIMDEPFTGMDALVKDELVRGLLELSGDEGWSVLLCSHDIGELEALADWVGFLDAGRLILSEPMEVLRGRFKRVEVMMNGGPFVALEELPPDWLSVDRAGKRATFLIPDHGTDSGQDEVHRRFPGAARVEVRGASLREVFVGLAREGLGRDSVEEETS
ncbi:MAG: ABC transporter ATP-binding protein [Gemmatimonadetes bacterium]|nr:ABC transporter ATP-binding protein [Gemmatimonadota bacterium]